MFDISTSGSFKNTESFLTNAPKADLRRILDSLGQQGTSALSASTPQGTGLAARSWYHEVKKTRKGWTLTWYNSDVENGFPVAVMIQHGHGTGTGGYVAGIDYINPALRPTFERILDQAWKAVIAA